MQHLIVQSSRHDLAQWDQAKWITNAAGHKFSTAFGFGLLDALKLVQKAGAWSPVADQEHCTSVPTDVAVFSQVTVHPNAKASSTAVGILRHFLTSLRTLGLSEWFYPNKDVSAID